MVILAATLAVAYSEGRTGCDFSVFWNGGMHWWEGANPYDPSGFVHGFPFVSPPTFLPIAATLALLDQKTSEAIWMLCNFIGTLALVPIALRVLRSDRDLRDVDLDNRVANTVLAATVALSIGSFSGLRAGQLSVLTTLSILVALQARDRGYRVLSGVCLAVATIKVATVLPFLLLFTKRKSDWMVWASSGLTVLLLCLVVIPPDQLTARLEDNLRNIWQAAGEGEINDYSFLTTSNFSIIGIDRALYCLGLRDRLVIRIAQLSLLGALALGIVILLHGRTSMSIAPVYALMACYSLIFLYHRIADTVLLSLPFCYTVHRARSGTGWARRLSAMAALCLLGAMQASGDIRICNWIDSMGSWSRLLQALVLPASTWLIVASMLFIVMDSRLRAYPSRQI